ncbi:MAG: hypothetical protein A3C27_02145 [Candidatus Levybacteria bacterium RIFCSPHIGHO2_02_FULL_39_36]|nr:MAG: Glycosyl transferase group 1 [Candidatus Levybacteria bacterium GW2011_GWA1_39_11]KKR24866.1 MAG: Glycosyl transferase group 1 [Candidatus Levybacteria bacterium GW2011_GWB1_39_7]KKR50107.1 MAG: Glycosyl transferase group 1 [Candidatus Levybacteria bacterium GW2011_GWA2_40_16]OGH15559.1 MAG: hypothetical protein A2689_00865 [Candidatus Levybacteria bacterium RIFCSPHIGHO2_01_FULL_38_96]OGH25357.1 MAG: hypothetical protein A3E68_01335 [Candidatus Levybacteria bacterium RIFCSPHIGHO2_12_FUL
MKVALVYDRVNKWGGAERVIIALRKIFPESDLFTSVYEKNRASWANKINVIPSFLQKIPLASRYHEAFALFMPIAFESFNFDKYDLVISVTSESGKGIITKPKTRHISVILTPTRYLWSGYKNYFPNELFRILAWPAVSYLRFWDKIAAKRPDQLIAISRTVQNRVKKYYDLESKIVYPPLMMRFARNFPQLASGKVPRSDYFLIVSRLVPYKRVDIAIKAANKLKIPLKIIGEGSEYPRLRKMAGKTVEFLGYVSDPDLKYYYMNCKALLFPGVEDFGLTIVEANAAGKPVIAYRGGGAEEIIIEGKTGEFFDSQTAASLTEVLKKFKPNRYNTRACKLNANRFSFERFRENFLKLVE